MVSPAHQCCRAVVAAEFAGSVGDVCSVSLTGAARNLRASPGVTRVAGGLAPRVSVPAF
jgi:hypothetical protein